MYNKEYNMINSQHYYKGMNILRNGSQAASSVNEHYKFNRNRSTASHWELSKQPLMWSGRH